MARNKTRGASPGSIADTVARLAVWGRHAPRGLAWVELVSEFARRRVVEQLRTTLSEEGIPVHEIELPRRQPAAEIVRILMARLRTLDKGMVSITGFATAFPDDVPLVDSLRMLNANRENLALFPLCQVWWMTGDFVEAFIRAAPDLDSWFMDRLQLTEVIEPPSGGKGLRDSPEVDQRPAVNIDDARLRAASLAERFRRAVEAGAPAHDQASLALSALKSLEEAGALEEARELADHQLSAVGQLVHDSGLEHPDTARLLTSLAYYHRIRGRYSDAESLLRRALQIQEKTIGPEHSDTARTLNNLAVLYERQGRYTEAELLHRRALAIREGVLGEHHPETATSLNNLALLCRSQGRYAEAEQLYRRALAIKEAGTGAGHPETATSLNNLALLLASQGRYAEAEPLYRRALAITERVLGADHPETATSLNNLAGLYWDQGRYKEAEPLHRRALAIRERALGADHPDTATSLNNIALLYHSLDRFAEAEPLYRRALAITERVLGADHAETAMTLNNLATLYMDQGRQGLAEPLVRRALTIAEGALGPDHPETKRIRENYGAIARTVRSAQV